MTLMVEYAAARDAEGLARLRRGLALRAMVASGLTQRRIAEELEVTQPAVSQQLRAADSAIAEAHPARLVLAGRPVLVSLAESRGFSRLALFGSVARGEARSDSDIDLLVQPPAEAGIRELLDLKRLFESVLLRSVDVVTYGALTPGLDDDITAEAVLL